MAKICCVIIGNKNSSRVLNFQKELYRQDFILSYVIDYQEALDNFDNVQEQLFNFLKNDRVTYQQVCIRIESSGENAYVISRVLQLDTNLRFADVSKNEAFIKSGGVFNFKNWFNGYRLLVDKITSVLELQCQSLSIPFHYFNSVDSIYALYDKYTTQKTLITNDIKTATLIGKIHGFSDLLEKMKSKGQSRVFVKSNYSSCASGILALQYSEKRGRIKASFAGELHQKNNEVSLYNSLKVRAYTKIRDVENIINSLCRSEVYAESWVAKSQYGLPTLSNKAKIFNYDIRVVSLGGKVLESIARLSESSFTNLHLGNTKLPLESIGIADKCLSDINSVIKKIHGLYPDLSYCGVDIVIPRHSNKALVLELNAFGDQINGAGIQSCIYTQQIKDMLTRLRSEDSKLVDNELSVLPKMVTV